MGKLNVIYALIVSIWVIIILNSLIKIFLRRSSSSSNFKNVSNKPKSKSKMVDLPDDVIRIILSKLDIITLRSFTTALSLDAFLPEIVSIATPLPELLFVHDRSSKHAPTLTSRIVNNILSKSWPRLKYAPKSMYLRLFNVLCTVDLLANAPTLLTDLRLFIRELSGLKLLEVELPAFPWEVSKDRPNFWYKWEGKIGVPGVVNHMVYVFGDRVDDEIEDMRVNEHVKRGIRIVERIRSVHFWLLHLGWDEGGSWKTGLTLRTKDVGGKGGLEYGPGPCFWKGGTRTMIFQLPSTSMFSKDSEQVQDVILVIQFISEKRYDAMGEVKAYLEDESEEPNPTTTMTELKQVVKEILADESCKLLRDVTIS